MERPPGRASPHPPVELVEPDLDVCLIGLAVLLATVDLSYPADSIGLRSIQVAAFDVVRVLAVVLRVQVLVHRLLLGAFHGAGQLDAVERIHLNLGRSSSDDRPEQADYSSQVGYSQIPLGDDTEGPELQASLGDLLSFRPTWTCFPAMCGI